MVIGLIDIRELSTRYFFLAVAHFFESNLSLPQQSQLPGRIESGPTDPLPEKEILRTKIIPNDSILLDDGTEDGPRKVRCRLLVSI